MIRMKISIDWKIILFWLVPIISLAVDYFNLFSVIGIDVSNLHIDFIIGMVNTLVVVTLYYITYMLVDKRQIQKDKNAKQITYVLMKSTYKKCLATLRQVNDRNILAKYIIPKIDFDKSDEDNQVTLNIQNNPFTEYPTLLEFSKDGIISPNDLCMYIGIMDKYRAYVSMRITLYDIEESDVPEHIEFAQTLDYEKVHLLEALNKEIAKLDSLLCVG